MMNNYPFEEGKVEQVCKKCNTKWMDYPSKIRTACPFCKAPIKEV